LSSRNKAKPTGAADESQPAEGRDRRKRKTREQVEQAILEASRALFEEHGYAGSTTREIATRAGVNEVWIYRYFGSKAKLFHRAIFDHLSQFIQRYAEDLPDRKDPLARARVFTGGLLARLREDRKAIFALITASEYELSHQQMPELDSFFEKAARTTADNVTLNVDVHFGVRMAFGMVLASVLFEDWLGINEIIDEKDLVEEISRMMMMGFIGSPPD
jgi:AcrR family transcriptional regulator